MEAKAPAASPQKATLDDRTPTPDGPQPNQRAGEQGGNLDRALQARIGSMLREAFEGIEGEPLPERLQDLIKQLQSGEEPR